MATRSSKSKTKKPKARTSSATLQADFLALRSRVEALELEVQYARKMAEISRETLIQVQPLFQELNILVKGMAKRQGGTQLVTSARPS